MKKAHLIGVGILIIIILFLTLTSGDPNKSQFTSSNGFQHKEFGSSSSLDGKPLILNQPETYVFEVKAEMETGYLSITVLNEDRNKEFLKIEGSHLDETKEVSLDAGTYAVEIETHGAEDGEFTLKYDKK